MLSQIYPHIRWTSLFGNIFHNPHFIFLRRAREVCQTRSHNSFDRSLNALENPVLKILLFISAIVSFFFALRDCARASAQSRRARVWRKQDQPFTSYIKIWISLILKCKFLKQDAPRRLNCGQTTCVTQARRLLINKYCYMCHGENYSK